ncbi:MAG: hypothetical protein GYA23_02195 [Methanomicrobiales archaeon]|nr:hypothetical protein [Methanomicrobiales archaeon]
MADTALEDLQYAGFPDRFAAFFLDLIIVGTLFFYLLEGVAYAGSFIGPLLFAGTAVSFQEPKMPAIFGTAAVGCIVLFLLSWVYSAGVTSSRYGGTFGKMIMGMKVIDVTGSPVTFGRASMRFFAKILSGLILFIGFFMIHFSPVKQGLHDRFSGTYVIYAKKAAPAPSGANEPKTVVPSEDEKLQAEASRQKTRKAIYWFLLIPAAGILLTVLLAAIVAAFVFSAAGNVSHTYVVAATVQQPDTDSLIVSYWGGKDEAEVSRIEIHINDQAPVYWDSPVAGKEGHFTGSPGKDHVLIMAHFKNGHEQVILDTFV